MSLFLVKIECLGPPYTFIRKSILPYVICTKVAGLGTTEDVHSGDDSGSLHKRQPAEGE